jgi:hypothetical protein
MPTSGSLLSAQDASHFARSLSRRPGLGAGKLEAGKQPR